MGVRAMALIVAFSGLATGLSACGGGHRQQHGALRPAGSRGMATASGGLTPSPSVTVPGTPTPPALESKGGVSGAPGAAGPVGFPSLATVGVPAGLSLHRIGPITVRTNGAVIDGVSASTEINVEADNVTVRNSRLTANGEWGIIQRDGHTGLRVENTEILGDGVNRVQTGILNQGRMLTVERVYIHTVSDGIQTDQGVVADSLISDLKEFPGDHCVDISSNGSPAPGMSLDVRHNTLLNPLGQTSAMSIYQDFGRAHDVTVEQNYLAGGGYALYGGKGQYGQSYNIRILNNVFGRRYYSNSGTFGPVTDFEQGPGNVWSGNTLESGGVVTP